ncbi:MAG: helix-turn-helix transcriptional regulator [Oscillospiraceae bacterium]|nr:helix-turn-helix transcriptional regulator [Oscillospiraceae bacterium]
MNQIKTGKFIAELRRGKGYTQEELGKKLGVSNKTVSRWENGNYMPDIETLRLLGRKFSVSMEELLDGERISAKKPAKTPDPFSPKERADFWRRNWKRENKSWFIFWGIIVFALAVFGFLWSSACFSLFGFAIFEGLLFGNIILILDALFAFGLYVYFYNKMCIYVDNNAYKLSED